MSGPVGNPGRADSALAPATSAPSPRSPVRRDTMTGLNLETFLRLLRADLGAWASLGAIVFVLALMTWTSWGSRKVLRKCLVLSVVAHVGLALFGSTLPMKLLGLRSKEPAGSS